jgi:integrase
MDSGERIAFLAHGKTGLPVIPTLHYMLVRYRGRGCTLNTMDNALRAIALGLDFWADFGIDLAQRTMSRRFLSSDELVALSERCRTTESDDGVRAVDPHYAATRFNTCIDYLLWIAEPVIARITDSSLHAATIKAQELFEKRVKWHGPRTDSDRKRTPEEMPRLSPDQREFLWRAIRPGSPENPYSPKLQMRNAAMIGVMYELGSRSGEVRGLKCSDFSFEGAEVMVAIHRRHDDVDDTRRDPALAKTRARVLPIVDPELCDWVDAWMTRHRSNRENFPEARKHPYFCVNYTGSPLGAKGLWEIVKTLERAYPELGRLFPHLFRHDWNNRWVKHNKDSGTEAADLRDQKYAMGWSDKSTMPLLYGMSEIRNSANEKISKMQRRGKRDVA